MISGNECVWSLCELIILILGSSILIVVVLFMVFKFKYYINICFDVICMQLCWCHKLMNYVLFSYEINYVTFISIFLIFNECYVCDGVSHIDKNDWWEWVLKKYVGRHKDSLKYIDISGRKIATEVNQFN